MITMCAQLGLLPANHAANTFYIACPVCDTPDKHGKHMNINLGRQAFRCPKCETSGGAVALYHLVTHGTMPADSRSAFKEMMDFVEGTDPEKVRLGFGKHELEERMRAIVGADAQYKPATLSERHATYSALLESMTLCNDHLQNLLSRGLTRQDINKAQYRSVPVFYGPRVNLQLTRELARKYARDLLLKGYSLEGIPGFFKENDTWTLTPAAGRGIYIPVRASDGRIQGLQIRLDCPPTDAQTGLPKGKYRWLSSKDKRDGSRAENWIHVASDGPITTKSRIVITEGPLKADVCHALHPKLSVIAIPGTSATSKLGDVLSAIEKKGVRQVIVALDMDRLSNPHVARAFDNICKLITSKGLGCRVWSWDPQYKGLDDYFVANRTPH